MYTIRTTSWSVRDTYFQRRSARATFTNTRNVSITYRDGRANEIGRRLSVSGGVPQKSDKKTIVVQMSKTQVVKTYIPAISFDTSLMLFIDKQVTKRMSRYENAMKRNKTQPVKFSKTYAGDTEYGSPFWIVPFFRCK